MEVKKGKRKHLWEYKHPYNMHYGCFFSGECHNEYDSFKEFLEEWGDSDIDYNWVIRWDWHAPSKKYAIEDHSLDIQFFIQRKAYPISCSIKVTPDDEPQVIKYLNPFVRYMKKMWAPFL